MCADECRTFRGRLPAMARRATREENEAMMQDGVSMLVMAAVQPVVVRRAKAEREASMEVAASMEGGAVAMPAVVVVHRVMTEVASVKAEVHMVVQL